MNELVLQNSRLDGRYDIERLLGRGSYAEIYVARDKFAPVGSLHQTVVIKALNVHLQDATDADLERTLLENFQNEALALDRVRHPNVISRLGHGSARDLNGTLFHYLVLEYLPGGDLSQFCKGAPLPLDKTLFYLEQACAGMSHAHSKNIVHRDIKPQNLLLTANREVVKIADFGVAKFENLDSPITRVGTNVYAAPEHSPLNMAAEIADGKIVRLTPAADVYSLAKMVYALLTGETPRRFANAPITYLPSNIAEQNWGREVLRILERATQRDADKRFQTVYEFWQQFYQLKISLAGDEATRVRVKNRDAAPTPTANSLKDFVPQAPARPAFDSLPNFQHARTTTPKPTPVLPPEQIAIVNSPPPNVREKQKIAVAPRFETLENAGAPQESGVTRGIKSFFRGLMMRFAVFLLIIGLFVGTIAGTYAYLQQNGWFDNLIFANSTDATAMENIFLRSTTSKDSDVNIIGYVTKNSELKVLQENGDWYQVVVVKQGQPDHEKITARTRGWVWKKFVDASK